MRNKTTMSRSPGFHSNPGAFCLPWELNRPSNWNKQLCCALLGNKRHKIACQYRKCGLVTFMYGCLCKTLIDRAITAFLSYALTHGFMHFPVFVFGVQHLRNVFICPNVDVAFHLLGAPMWPTTHSVVVVVMMLSHNAKHDQRVRKKPSVGVCFNPLYSNTVWKQNDLRGIC